MSGRPRTPTKVLEMRGAFKRNPKRKAERAGEPVILTPLGQAPDSLDGVEHACWNEIAEMYPWLDHSHRLIVEISARLLARVRNRVATPAEVKQLVTNIRACGGTPSDSSKVSMPPPPTETDAMRKKYLG